MRLYTCVDPIWVDSVRADKHDMVGNVVRDAVWDGVISDKGRFIQCIQHNHDFLTISSV